MNYVNGGLNANVFPLPVFLKIDGKFKTEVHHIACCQNSVANIDRNLFLPLHAAFLMSFGSRIIVVQVIRKSFCTMQ
jgi:hypothetical protein